MRNRGRVMAEVTVCCAFRWRGSATTTEARLGQTLAMASSQPEVNRIFSCVPTGVPQYLGFPDR